MAPFVALAEEVTPAEVAALAAAGALGVCSSRGATTGHAAILARAMGLPMVAGLGEALLAAPEGAVLALDGAAGRAWLDPPPALAAELARRGEVEARQRAEALASAAAPAVTRDGRRIEVMANIGGPADAAAAVAAGAEGVGVFRTELLFLDRQEAPGEDEQHALYLEAARALAGRPLTVRTLDAGGDKPLPYLHLPPEANPQLGERALRLCLARPELFKVQLRAILRVAASHPVRLLLPMVATVSEWRAAMALVEEARGEVRRRGGEAPPRLVAGAMIEIPAAALQAGALAVEADFLSIGTNDLTQYTLAAERGNARLAALADALQPAVLDLVRRTVEAAHAKGKPVAVCGELAADPLAIPLLVGLGVDELSMSAPAIPRAKALVRTLDASACRALAGEVLSLPDLATVRQRLAAWAAERSGGGARGRRELAEDKGQHSSVVVERRRWVTVGRRQCPVVRQGPARSWSRRLHVLPRRKLKRGVHLSLVLVQGAAGILLLCSAMRRRSTIPSPVSSLADSR